MINDNLERLGIEDIAKILTWSSSWNGTWTNLINRLKQECTDYPKKVEDFFKTQQDETEQDAKEKFALYSRMKEQGLDVSKIQEPRKPLGFDSRNIEAEHSLVGASGFGLVNETISANYKAPESVDENGRLVFP